MRLHRAERRTELGDLHAVTAQRSRGCASDR